MWKTFFCCSGTEHEVVSPDVFPQVDDARGHSSPPVDVPPPPYEPTAKPSNTAVTTEQPRPWSKGLLRGEAAGAMENVETVEENEALHTPPMRGTADNFSDVTAPSVHCSTGSLNTKRYGLNGFGEASSSGQSAQLRSQDLSRLKPGEFSIVRTCGGWSVHGHPSDEELQRIIGALSSTAKVSQR